MSSVRWTSALRPARGRPSPASSRPSPARAMATRRPLSSRTRTSPSASSAEACRSCCPRARWMSSAALERQLRIGVQAGVRRQQQVHGAPARQAVRTSSSRWACSSRKVRSPSASARRGMRRSRAAHQRRAPARARTCRPSNAPRPWRSGASGPHRPSRSARDGRSSPGVGAAPASARAEQARTPCDRQRVPPSSRAAPARSRRAGRPAVASTAVARRRRPVTRGLLTVEVIGRRAGPEADQRSVLLRRRPCGTRPSASHGR